MSGFLDWLSDPLAAIRAGYAPNKLTQSAKDQAKSNSQFDNTNNQVHDNLNNFIGGIGNGLGGAGDWLVKNSNPQMNPQFQIAKFAMGLIPPPNRTAQDQGDQSATDSFMAKYGRRDGGISDLEREKLPSETDKILARLGQRFTFDGAKNVDTTQIDAMLKAKQGVLDDLANKANDNFAKSDHNIDAMHSAFKNDQLGQAGRIQQEGDTAGKTVAGIFDKTVASNNEALAKHNSDQEEMLKRLGIAPAANAPDQFAAEIARGNNTAQSGRDARTGEIAGNTQTNLTRNTAMANAIGNDGVQRRSDLNMRLQDVLGGINGKRADMTADYQKSKMELNNQGEDRAYQRWLQDRQFDMGLFNSINSSNAKMAQAQAKGSTVSGSAGIMQDASPQMKKALYEVATKVNIFNEPEKAMKMLQDPKYGLDPNEVFQKVSDYAKLGSSNKFPAVPAE